MLKQTVNKNNIHVPVGVSSFATSSNDLNTNQRLLRHVISRDYITHEFRVIPKQKVYLNHFVVAYNSMAYDLFSSPTQQ